MYKRILENNLTQKMVDEAIRKMVEYVNDAFYVEDWGPDEYKGMKTNELQELFVNRYGKKLFEVAKGKMYPVRSFRYYGSELDYAYRGTLLFERPAFRIMSYKMSSVDIQVSEANCDTEKSGGTQCTNLYITDEGELRIVDEMWVYLGKHTDIVYLRDRHEFHPDYVEFKLDELEAWLKLWTKNIEEVTADEETRCDGEALGCEIDCRNTWSK